MKYINGDSDGDGSVTIIDATVIQRVLAGYPQANADMVHVRGDIDQNGLSILDATMLQRYLAQLENPHQIGKTLFYTPPQSGTETMPTRDPNELPEDEL